MASVKTIRNRQRRIAIENEVKADVRQHGCWVTALSRRSSADLAKLCALNCLFARPTKSERVQQLFIHYTTM